jgi:hypothetical protein
VARVVDVKRRSDKQIVILDGGINLSGGVSAQVLSVRHCG